MLGVVYGTRWTPAGSALAALAILGGLRIVFDLAYDLLAGVGRSRSLLGVQVAWFAGLLIALPIGASTGGIGGVAIAHVVVAFVLVGPLYLIALRHTGLAVGRVLTALAPAAAASMGCVVVIAIGGGLGFVGLPAVVVLGTAGVPCMRCRSSCTLRRGRWCWRSGRGTPHMG